MVEITNHNEPLIDINAHAGSVHPDFLADRRRYDGVRGMSQSELLARMHEQFGVTVLDMVDRKCPNWVVISGVRGGKRSWFEGVGLALRDNDPPNPDGFFDQEYLLRF